MSWQMMFTKTAMAAGVIVAMAGCGGREKVAIAAKDETIRRQEELLAKEKAEKDSLYEANKALGDQNDRLARDSAEAANRQAAEMARLTQKFGEMEAAMRGMDSKFAQLKPGQQGLNDDQPAGWIPGADGSIKIIVASSVLFDSGKADLKSSAHPTLKDICSTIKSRFPNNFIRVEGHTDSTPVVRNKDKFKDNMELSIARSRQVYDFMIHGGGIAANKMYTAGYGEFQPIVRPERTASDRAKNRRVEIVIMPTNVRIEKQQMSESGAPRVQTASIPAKKK